MTSVEAQWPFASALVVLYLLAGLACATWAVARDQHRGPSVVVDALLLVSLWPLYAPFAFASRTEEAANDMDREQVLLRALKRARGTAMATLLPDGKSARWLCRHLRLATARVRDIDQVLGRPEMSEAVALAHLEVLGAQSRAETRSAALMRLQNIRQLVATRERFVEHLQQVDVVLEQVIAQAELVRLVGNADSAPEPMGHEVLRDLVVRVEALGQMLDDGAGNGNHTGS